MPASMKPRARWAVAVESHGLCPQPESADLDAVGTEIREVRLTKEGTGSYYSWRTKMAGVPLEGFDVYTDVEPNKHITDKSSSAWVAPGRRPFEPERTGTTVTMEHHSRSFWRIPPTGLPGRPGQGEDDADVYAACEGPYRGLAYS